MYAHYVCILWCFWISKHHAKRVENSFQNSRNNHPKFIRNSSKIHSQSIQNPSKMPPETDFRKRSRKRMAMGPTMELQEGHFWRLVSHKNQKMFQMQPKRNQKSEKRACNKCYKCRCRTKIKNGAKKLPTWYQKWCRNRWNIDAISEPAISCFL